MISEEVKSSIDRYVQQGVETGGFLRAVLENNLMEALGRADIHNRYNLFDICGYLYNDVPGECHGSPEKVTAWLKKKAEEREKKNPTPPTQGVPS